MTAFTLDCVALVRPGVALPHLWSSNGRGLTATISRRCDASGWFVHGGWLCCWCFVARARTHLPCRRLPNPPACNLATYAAVALSLPLLSTSVLASYTYIMRISANASRPLCRLSSSSAILLPERGLGGRVAGAGRWTVASVIIRLADLTLRRLILVGFYNAG